ncbi:MAG: O-antigen translocase [Spirosomataceae bacterium]
MLSRIKQIYKKDVAAIFSLNVVSTLVKMLAGFVSVKVVAVLVGPAGIALMGQLSNFSSIAQTFSTGGINNGITKYIASTKESGGEVRYIRAAVWIVGIFTLLTGFILLFGSSYFSIRVLKDSMYQPIFMVFGLTIGLYAFNTMLVAVLNGYKEFKKYVRVNIVGSLVSLCFSIILSYVYGVYGALLAMVTYQSVVLLVTLQQVASSSWFRVDHFIGRFDIEAVKKLANYSLMAFVSAATVPVSQLIVRNYTVETISLTQAGIWEGMNRISNMYLMVITSSLSVYYLPRLAEIKSDVELRNEIFSIYKMVIPFLLLATLGIYGMRDIIINLLFNKEFEGMRELFAYQLLGDFFKITSWLLAYLMLARSMTKLFVVSEVLFSVSFALLAMGFIDMYGEIGATLAYALNYFLYLATVLIIFRKIICFHEK